MPQRHPKSSDRPEPVLVVAIRPDLLVKKCPLVEFFALTEIAIAEIDFLLHVHPFRI